MYKHVLFRANAFAKVPQIGTQARFLASVTNNATRQTPVGRPRAKPRSHERATLTIKVRQYMFFYALKTDSLTRRTGRANPPRHFLRCKDKHLRRSCFHYIASGLPRVYDRSFLPRTDPRLHTAIDRQLRRAIRCSRRAWPTAIL